MQAIIGIDIGTTGCRAVIHRTDGTLLANQSVDYPLYTPYPSWVEQDPEEIFQAVIAAIKKAVAQAGPAAHEITGMCFGAAFHSFIPVDKDGNALYRMLNWADHRSQPYTEKLKAEHDAKAIYARTGCPLHPMYMPSKILWFKQEEPALFRRTHKFITIKEYVLHRFLGKYAVDRSLASGSGLYNIHDLCWDRELLAILGIAENMFSTVVPTTHVEQAIAPQIASQLNLPADISIVIGAGDGMLSNVGAGAVNPGQLTAMIGTSGAVRLVTDRPTIDAQGRTWCYNLTDKYWVAGGAINNGGIAFRWLRDKFAETEQRVAEKLGLDAYQILSGYAEKVPVGSGGLILLPFFAGERAPYWNASARGVLFGLNLNHDKRHIIRATLEGITFRMFSIYQALNQVAGPVNEIRVSGSFTRSKLWVQIMADVFGKVINVPGEPEGSAFGAVVLGMHALGILKDVKEVGNFINIKERYYPDDSNHQRYLELYAVYERIYWNLQDEFAAIARMQQAWQ
ncbi:MAG: gluconokinase [Negativicutes bacterium]|nr:gluconokinase [Negativicutes bacterium]